MTRACLPLLRKAKVGHIVNIGSIAGFETYKGGAGYTSVKHAVRAISRTLRLELNGEPIRVTEIAPGLVETEFSLVRFKGDRKAAKAVYTGLKPLTAEDVADCVVFAVTRPPHVDIDEIVLRPVAQATTFQVTPKDLAVPLLDQSGRTGLIARHSTTGIAVMAAAGSSLAAADPGPSARSVAATTATPLARSGCNRRRSGSSRSRPRTRGAGACSLVVVSRELDPARVGAPARRRGVRAVDARSRPWIDVQLAVDDERVADVRGHVRRPGEVLWSTSSMSPAGSLTSKRS